MIRLTKGATQTIIVTLREKETLTNPNYLFVFNSRLNDRTVGFVILNSSDNSLFKERYNEFDIVVNNFFVNEACGIYSYKVYEQISTTNVNPAGLNCVESGLMKLFPSSVTLPTEYQGTAIKDYKVYSG